MTQKRYIKLIMSQGVAKRDAEAKAIIALCVYKNYEDAFNNEIGYTNYDEMMRGLGITVQNLQKSINILAKNILANATALGLEAFQESLRKTMNGVDAG